MMLDSDTRCLYVTQEEYQVILNYVVTVSPVESLKLSPRFGSIGDYASVQVIIDEEKAKAENYYEI